MARNRMIKPEFWKDDGLAEVSPYSRLLYIGLWNFADDEGYLEYRLRKIKAECLPYDDVDIEKLLNELVKTDKIEIRGGIIWVKNFLKHQRIDKPKSSPLSQMFKDSKNLPGKVDDESTTKREEKLKEVKEKEEERGSEEGDAAFAAGSEELELAHALFQSIRLNNPTSMPKLNSPEVLKTHLQKWAAEFDKILRIDGRPFEDVKAVMYFSQTDSFWKANILSPPKLREKYDQLKAKMGSKKSSGVFIS